MTKEERIEKAVSLFKEGYNCSQSVVAAFAEKGATKGSDRESKAATYALVQELAAKFKEETGSLRCSDLLGLSKKEPIVSTPEARTSAYYAKRPCAKMVETAARIWADYIYIEKNSALQSYRHDFRFMFSVISL